MICEKCKSPFPTRIKIDGKIRVLGNRKYCLTCSPFGKHNTRPFDYIRKGPRGQNGRLLPTAKVCPVCTKPCVSLGKKCNSCQVNIRRFKIKQRARELLGSKCGICGYDKCMAVLGFHHIDPATKLFEIASGYCHSWEKIKQEVAKCQLLCANCHMELHYNEQELNRNILKCNLAAFEKEQNNLVVL